MLHTPMPTHYKTASFAIGLLLCVTPALANAQTAAASEGSMIAALQELVAVLTQELSALIAARSHGGSALQAGVPAKSIQAAGTAPEAVVDQALLSIPAVPDTIRPNLLGIAPISGAAANTSGVAVVVIIGSYSGPTDFLTASRFGQSQPASSTAPMPILFMNVPVVGGRWQTDRITFVQQPPPQLTVLVYSNPDPIMSGTAQPIAQSVVYISSNASIGASVDQALATIPATPDPKYQGFLTTAPFTGTATGIKQVTLVALPGTYLGPTDFGTAATAATSSAPIVFPNLAVINGRWRSGSISFGTAPPTLLSLLVYGGATTTASSSLPIVQTTILIAAASSTATSTVATATVDQAALPIQASADSTNPGVITFMPLSGTAKGENSLSIVVVPGQYSGNLDFYSASQIKPAASLSASAALPVLFLNRPVLNGTWQTGTISLPQSVPPQFLTVLVYDYVSAAKSIDLPIAVSTITVLPTLKVTTISNSYPTATIDQSAGALQLQSDPSREGYAYTPPFTGTAKNTQNVTIAVIPGTYTGGTDFASVSHLAQTTGGASVPTLFPYTPVQNGRWQTGTIAFTLPHPSTLTVLVYDAAAAAAGTGNPITTAIFGL